MATYEQIIAKSKELAAAGDMAGAKRLAKIALDRRASMRTNIVEQAGSGTSEGVASFLGFPVDAATALLNGMMPSGQYADAGTTLEGGVKLAPTNAPPMIQNPVGGGSTFRKLLEPFISDVAPQNMWQRYARRIGQEVGFGVPAALTGAALAAPAQASMPAYMATSAAGDVGAGVAGQTSREIAPDNEAADFWASLIGGGGASLAASRMTPEYGGNIPTVEDVKATAGRKYTAVRESDAVLTPEAFARLRADLETRLGNERATNPLLFPRSRATLDDIGTNPDLSLYGIEENRRLIGRNVAGNADEARVGVALKQEIDDYLKSLTPADVTGSGPDQAIRDLMEARALAARGHRADAVLNKGMRGETRAATTGSGGNEVNATRQNIRTLYDVERDPTLRGRSQGFTPDEMAQMDRVVMGTDGQNFARRFAKFSPASGALGMLGGFGGAGGLTGALATGNPLLSIPAILPAIGMVAKGASEAMTKNEIKKLLDTITSGGALKPSDARRAAKAGVLQQLLSTALQGNQQ